MYEPYIGSRDTVEQEVDVTERNLTDRAFDQIERMIVLQEIPPGSLISEKQLTELTGIGRTPVREALQRLARDRMVEIHPQRGVLVPASSIEAQLKLLELRRVLEPFAAQLAAARARPNQREHARDMLDRLDASPVSVEDFPTVLRDSHEFIVEAAQNEFLSVAMAPLQGLSRRFWFAHLTDPEAQVQEAVALHRGILHAIVKADGAGAEAASLALNDYLVAFTYDTLPKR
ncbi:GntR family transcriptional regulator [Agromyces silvae]|uniref:GntR family transcriptional regulator n=1 Tax=Agromyces silvae TaxID=3388266 RepID=UPI00280B418C|nr:GntR family transcriptional regulator [Agromyces protaetiae]